jgi:hypothetical protein
MNAARELLTELQSLGVVITPSGDKLRIKAPIGVITPALRETLTSRKGELLQLLTTNKRALPHVWQFIVDGKRVWGIDAERLSESDYLDLLHGKFGAARVKALVRASE